MPSRALVSYFLLALIYGILALLPSTGFAQTATATGPLSVHPSNPRYFVDPSGKAIYLTGSHVWNNLQDGNGIAFNFTNYLNLVKSNNQNFIRLWVSETPKADVGINPAPTWNGISPWYKSASPLPYARTGTGTAADGKAKFDLQQWNQAYFNRLRARVVAARDQGVYVGIMLFNSWGSVNHNNEVPGRNVWRYHPLNPNNNTSGLSGDLNGNGDGEETHTLQVAAVTLLQEAYVRKVVDTVNDLDNVIYEISRGDNSEDPTWQYHVIDIITTYEAGKPKQHPVGMTSGPSEAQLSQPGSWMSPIPQAYDNPADPYASSPPAVDGTRISLLDTDHIGYMMFRDNPAFIRTWVWKSFLRGHHPLLMEDLGTNAGWISGRAAMGHTHAYATRMNLGAMTPQDTLSSTGYCLASLGNEYLVYQGGSGAFSVNLVGDSYNYEWFNPSTGTMVTSGVVGAAGGSQSFTPPFQGPAVLYLKASGVAASQPPTSPGGTGTSYQASTDFSSVQGYRGWYHYDSLGRPMTYDAGGAYWQGSEPYLLLWNGGGHPGAAADAILRWVAPSAGTVRITGTLADGDTGGGDGIVALILQDATVLWQQVIANGDTAGIAFDLTRTVSAGTALDFVINRGPNGSNDNDSTNFDPHITYTSTSPTSPPPASGRSATLAWEANTEPDLAGYRVYQRTASGPYGAPVSLGRVTSYTASNLAPGTQYYFKITAMDFSGNEGPPSAEMSVPK